MHFCVTVFVVAGKTAIIVLSIFGMLGHAQIELNHTNVYLTLLHQHPFLATAFQINFAIAQFYASGIVGFSVAFAAIWCVLCKKAFHDLAEETEMEVQRGALWATVGVSIQQSS